MSSFILNSSDDKKKIVKLTTSDAYSFSPKNQQGHFTKIKTVKIYDPETVEKIIVNKYTIKYKRLAKIIKALLASENDDETESDYMIALDEIAKLKDMLLIKYQAFLKKEMFEYFLSDLFFLEKVLQERLIEIRNSQMMDYGGR